MNDDYKSRKFLVTLIGLALVGLSARWKNLDTGAVSIIVLGYNGANAAVKASANVRGRRR